MHEYWGFCSSCQRGYACEPALAPGSLPADYRCPRCGAAPDRLEIRLEGEATFSVPGGSRHRSVGASGDVDLR